MLLQDASTGAILRIVAFLMLCIPAAGQQRDAALHRLFDAYYEEHLRENPEEATSVGLTEHDTRWRDWSRPARDAWRAKLAGFLEELDAFPLPELDVQDRISATLLRKQIETELEGMAYDAYLLRVNQLFGLHTVVFLTMREMPARTDTDYENMLARLRALPAYIEQNVSALREALDAGVLQPKLVVDTVVAQLEAQSKPDAANSPLLQAFSEFPETVPEARQREFAAEARRLYRDAFRPAWNALKEFLIEEYEPRARAGLAVTSLEGGDAIYRFFIRYHTTLPLSPREIHETGLREVERIDRQMDRIAREAGFEAGADAYERHLTTDPRYLFQDKDTMLAYHRDVALRVSPGLTRLFHKLPRHPFGIRASTSPRSCCTKPTRAIISRSLRNWNSKDCPSFAGSIARPLTSRAGRSTRRPWATNSESTTTLRAASAHSRASDSGRADWWSTRGCTRWGGRGSARSITSETRARSTATSRGPAKRWPTRSASSRSWN